MAIDSDIRAQAYQAFIQEAPDLLQAIEQGLLILVQDHTTANVHNVMRAAHSIKGGAASIGLEGIKSLAHRLEEMFKALYSQELEIDAELKGLLLLGYDCLRLPLTEQMNTGHFDAEQALAVAEPVFAKIEAALGDFLTNANHLPGSVELGVDLALEIFAVDVAQGLERLTAVVANPEINEVAGELRAQVDTFAGLAELLSLPGFGAIAQSAIAALNAHPEQALKVTQLALADFQAGQKAVMGGDRTEGGTPSPALVNLATPLEAGLSLVEPESVKASPQASLENIFSTFGDIQASVPAVEIAPPEPPLVLQPEVEATSLDDMFGDFSPVTHDLAVEETSLIEVASLEIIPPEPPLALQPEVETASLDDVFGDFSPVTHHGLETPPIEAAPEALEALALDDVFSGAEVGSGEESFEPSIRDQAYQFFIQEAPDLLQAIEQGLLTLAQDHTIANVHNIMRAAHSIKGGAASVGLDGIKSIAHRLEDMFKGLYSEELEINSELEGLLLQGYDCLRLPLTEEISTGRFDTKQALAIAEPVFAQIEAALGDFLTDADHLPSSVELGVDLALEIFAVDVAQGLEQLAVAVAQPETHPVGAELQAQADTFAGLAELLGLQGFGAIAQAALTALEAHPEQALEIAQLALADFQAGQQGVVGGDRTEGGTPSPALVNLANPSSGEALEIISAAPAIAEAVVPQASIEDVFSASKDLQASDVLIPGITPTEPQELMEPEENLLDADTSLSSEITTAQTSPQDIPLAEPEAPSEPALRSGETIQEAIQSIEQQFESLPSLQEVPTSLPSAISSQSQPVAQPTVPQQQAASSEAAARLSVRVDLDRLERMNNQVGELSINRNSLSLQNEQLQGAVQELLRRFAKFQEMSGQLSDLSDQMLVSPEHHLRSSREVTSMGTQGTQEANAPSMGMPGQTAYSQADFDSLEMDSYGELHLLLQATLEQMVQLEETISDIAVFSGESSQSIDQQRQTLTYLQDDLMWARMLPLGEVLNRYPRIMRDLAATHHKPVDLKLNGTGVLVDKAALEKLYDPLLHLLRNAFDHGIEPSDARRRQGKSERGQIEIRAYHQGSQTIIEVRDDGQGLNLERIGRRAVEMGLLSAEQLAATPTSRLVEVMFEPGFSTASQVSELSGRGVGLDIVRSQLRSLKGNVTVTFEPGRGTTFSLSVPLTLTITKLLVCLVGSTAFSFPSDSIEEILIPQAGQTKQSGRQKFLHWREQLIPAYQMSNLVDYACPLPETVLSQALVAVPTPEEWAAPMLLLRQGGQFLALEVDRLLTEQELVVKPFGSAIAPPGYIYGCTILGDGSLIPVIDGAALLGQAVGETVMTGTSSDLPEAVASQEAAKPIALKAAQSLTLLVVDDSVALRQTLALTLQKAGYRVLQARDGREAIEQLQKNSAVQMVVCDVEMPNMNGFEFLSARRQDPQLAKVPVAMLTSRSSDKHRGLATHLGANAYFTKPYIEQEFLAAIKKIIAQGAYPETALHP